MQVAESALGATCLGVIMLASTGSSLVFLNPFWIKARASSLASVGCIRARGKCQISSKPNGSRATFCQPFAQQDVFQSPLARLGEHWNATPS